MAKKSENKAEKPRGTGKFFLGAALGAIAGAIASKFISTNVEDDSCDGCLADEKECKCADKCCCEKKQESKNRKTEKAAEKKK